MTNSFFCSLSKLFGSNSISERAFQELYTRCRKFPKVKFDISESKSKTGFSDVWSYMSTDPYIHFEALERKWSRLTQNFSYFFAVESAHFCRFFDNLTIFGRFSFRRLSVKCGFRIFSWQFGYNNGRLCFALFVCEIKENSHVAFLGSWRAVRRHRWRWLTLARPFGPLCPRVSATGGLTQMFKAEVPADAWNFAWSFSG